MDSMGLKSTQSITLVTIILSPPRCNSKASGGIDAAPFGAHRPFLGSPSPITTTATVATKQRQQEEQEQEE